jgi:hypothetical protein
MNFPAVAYIHNSTTFPVDVAASIENTTIAVLSCKSYPPFVDNALLPFEDAEKLLATVNTPLVAFVTSKFCTPSITFSPNVSLLEMSIIETATGGVGCIVVGSIVVCKVVTGGAVLVVGATVVVGGEVVVGLAVVVGAVIVVVGDRVVVEDVGV